MKPGVLIIDDETKLSALLARIIELEGYPTWQAATGKEGLKMMERESVQVVLSDVKLPDVSGVELVKQLKEKKPYVEVFCLTAYGTIADGVTAIKNGAFDYITKGSIMNVSCPYCQKPRKKRKYSINSISLKINSSTNTVLKVLLVSLEPYRRR